MRSSPASTAIPPASTSMAMVNGGKRMLEDPSLPYGSGGAVNASQQQNIRESYPMQPGWFARRTIPRILCRIAANAPRGNIAVG